MYLLALHCKQERIWLKCQRETNISS